MAKSEQLPGDALIAPVGILAGQPQHGLSKIRRDGWAPAGAVRGSSSVARSNCGASAAASPE
jgi:hypothetical protein